MEITNMSAKQVLAWVAENMKEQGTIRSRSQIATSFKRLGVDGKTLVDLCTRKRGRDYKMNSYGVPKCLQESLVKAVKATGAKKPKGRGKPKFVGYRTLAIAKGEKAVRDSPMFLQRAFDKKDLKNKKTFDKQGWPTVEFVFPERAGRPMTRKAPADRVPRATKAFTVQPVEEFRKLNPTDLAAWAFRALPALDDRRKARLSMNLFRFKATGNVLASIALTKCSRKRSYALATYAVPLSVRKALVKAVRTALPTTEAPAKKATSTIKLPSGKVVRDSAVTIARHMYYFEQKKLGDKAKKQEEFRWDGTVSDPKAEKPGPVQTKADLNREKRMQQLEGTRLTKSAAFAKMASMGVQQSHREELYQECLSIWSSKAEEKKSEDTVSFGGKKIRNSTVAIAKFCALQGRKTPSITDGFPEFVWSKTGFQPVNCLDNEGLAAWAKKTFAGETGVESLARGLKRSKISGDVLARTCFVKKGRTGGLQAAGVPKSLRKKVVRAVKKGSPYFKVQKTKVKTVRLPTGKLVRDSTVAIAKHMRWQKAGYQPVAEGTWPEFQLVANPPKLEKLRGHTYRRLKKKTLTTGLPAKDGRKTVRKLDSKGWPEFEIKVASAPTTNEATRLSKMDTDALVMWVREQIGDVVGVKTLCGALRRAGATGRDLVGLRRHSKHRNAILTSLGAPHSTRKPLVKAVLRSIKKSDLSTPQPTAWLGFTDIKFPNDEKTTIRDSSVAIAKHIAKQAQKKGISLYGAKVPLFGLKTAVDKNGWPAHEWVTEKRSERTAPKTSSTPLLERKSKATAQWASEQLSRPGASSVARSFKKLDVTGKTLASIAHDKRSGKWRLGSYGVPISQRKELVRAVKREVKSFSEPKARTHITVDGEKIRNSTVSLFLHEYKKAKAALGPEEKLAEKLKNISLNKNTKADILEASPAEIASWLSLSVPAYVAKKVASLASGRALCAFATEKKGRAAKMNAWGVPKRYRQSFFQRVKGSAPPQYKKSDRSFAGESEVKLPTGKGTVRDSAMSIYRALAKQDPKQSLKKTFDKQGWPTVNFVEKKAEATSLSITAPKIFLNITGYSSYQASDYVSHQTGDKFLGKRVKGFGLSGRDLASLARDKSARNARLNMYGVPMRARKALIKSLRRDVPASKPRPAKAAHWFSEEGEKLRKSVVSVAIHLARKQRESSSSRYWKNITISKEQADQISLDDKKPSQVACWVAEVLHAFPNALALANRLQRLNVSGTSLRKIVGSSSGRSHRFSAYGVPHSLRLPLVQAVRAEAGSWSEPKKAKGTVVCPDGKKVRNSSVSIAIHMAKASGKKAPGGTPKVEFFQSPRAPVSALRSVDMSAFVAKHLAGETGAVGLSKTLSKLRITGPSLLDMCRKRSGRNTRLSAYGVPFSLRKALVSKVLSLAKGQETPKQEAPLWVGRRARVGGKFVFVACDNFAKEKAKAGGRDSALSLDIHRHRVLLKAGKRSKNAETFPNFVFVEKATKSKAQEFSTFSSLTTDQLAAWVAQNLGASKRTSARVAKALSKAKYDGAKLAALVSSKDHINAQLVALGISKSVRSKLINAVRKADPKGFKIQEKPKMKRAKSQMVNDFKEARKQKNYTENWPDMEFIHLEKHPRGGQQVVRSVIKAAQLTVIGTGISTSIENQA